MNREIPLPGSGGSYTVANTKLVRVEATTAPNPGKSAAKRRDVLSAPAAAPGYANDPTETPARKRVKE
jgi:hypothetical protein